MTNWQVITGDCLEVMPTLADSSIDLILTDPPYYKVKSEWWDRQWDTAAGFLSWLDRVLAEFYRVLKPNGSLYLFASPRMAARVEVLTGERFNVLNHIVWYKSTGNRNWSADKSAVRSFLPNTERIIFAEHYGADGIAKGPIGDHYFQPIQSRLTEAKNGTGIKDLAAISGLPLSQVSHYFRRDCNGWRMPTQAVLDAMRINLREADLRREYEDLRREYEDLRRPFNVTADVPYTDVWTFPTVQSYPGKHPAEKPQALLRHIIAASSKPGAVVLDAFAGSGSAGVAALDMGREFIGIDADSKWAEYARARIAKAAEQARQLELI